MTLDEFMSQVLSNNGGYVDVDKEYGPQCWDLVELYAEQMGVPKEPWAIPLGPLKDAYEAWTVPSDHMDKYFSRIEEGSQERGDINVYGPKPGFPEGHICIDLGNGQVFQQNASIEGSPSHVETRSTSYLLGALRIKGVGMDDEDIKAIYLAAGKSEADANLQANLDYWRGKKVEELAKALYKSQTDDKFYYYAVHYVSDVTTLQAELAAKPGAGTILTPGNYTVKS